MTEINRILVVAAHPDDEVLGCGGTIVRHSREGQEVYIAILGEGITSRYKKRAEADRKFVEALQGDSRQVAAILGAKDIFLSSLPDNRFDTVPLLDIVKTIEDIISNVKPNIIYTHHWGDLNIDHSLTFRAVLTATRPMPGCPVLELYSFEVPSSTEWSFGQIETTFQPNTFVNIADSLEEKIKAMQVYENELSFFPHPRSPEALRAIAEKWGSAVGFSAVEAFQLVRSIRP